MSLVNDSILIDRITKNSSHYKSKFIFVKKNDENAILPSHAHEGDVGFDLYPIEDYELKPGKTTLCRTGIILADTPEPLVVGTEVIASCFLKIEGRSGLALKGIFPVGGIIDPEYRGEIKVVLFNSTDTVFNIPKEKAMAQLIAYYTCSSILPNYIVRFVETKDKSESERGSDGFGSTDTVEKKE